MELIGDDGVADEEFEGHDVEGGLVGGFQDDGAGGTCLLDLEPAGGTDAPAVAGAEAGESVFRHGGGEVVAEGLGGGEERLVHDAADGVDAEVFGASFAAAGTVKARHGFASAGGDGLAKDVFSAGLGFSGQRFKAIALGRARQAGEDWLRGFHRATNIFHAASEVEACEPHG